MSTVPAPTVVHCRGCGKVPKYRSPSTIRTYKSLEGGRDGLTYLCRQCWGSAPARKREARKRGVVYCRGCGKVPEYVYERQEPSLISKFESLEEGAEGLTYLCRACQNAVDDRRARAKRRYRSEADKAIWAALDRAGMTLGEACLRADVHPSTVDHWRRGGEALHDTLQRFVDVLDAPDLLAAIRWRWRWITLTCQRCGRTLRWKTSALRYHQGRGALQEVSVDWATGQGSDICVRCGAQGRAYKMGRQQQDRLVKKGGRQLVRRRFAAIRQVRVPPSAAGRRAGPETRWALAVSHIRPRPTGKWGLCLTCYQVAHGKKRVEAHADCLHEHQRTIGGLPPPYPSRAPGRQFSPSEIPDIFELAVRVLIKGEQIGRSEHEGGRGLAAQLGLTERTIYNRIDWLLEHLPADGRGGKRLAFWARALRWAKSYRDLKAWARANGWPWSRVLLALSPRNVGSPN